MIRSTELGGESLQDLSAVALKNSVNVFHALLPQQTSRIVPSLFSSDLKSIACLQINAALSQARLNASCFGLIKQEPLLLLKSLENPGVFFHPMLLHVDRENDRFPV